MREENKHGRMMSANFFLFQLPEVDETSILKWGTNARCSQQQDMNGYL